MIRLKIYFSAIVVNCMLILGMSFPIFAATISGSITDEFGKPFSNVNLAIIPVKDGLGAWFPDAIGNQNSVDGGLLAFPATINRGGKFTIKYSDQGVVLLGTLPFYKSEIRIIKIKIGEIYLFPNKMDYNGNGIVLELKPEDDITNVEITVRDVMQKNRKPRQKSTTRGSSLHYIAQRRTGSLSGRIIYTDGNPVANLPVFVCQLDISPEEYFWTAILPPDYPKLLRAQSDEVGQFSITGITSAPQNLSILPYNIVQRLPKNFETIVNELNKRANQLPFHSLKPYIQEFEEHGFGTEINDFEPDVEIVSFQINGITYYPRVDFRFIPFGIVPGKHIKDVVVTVRPRTSVKGRVLFNDGTPLTNTRITLNYEIYGTTSRSSSNENKVWIDPDGYFVYYLDEKQEQDTLTCTFSVEYQGLKATAKPFQVEPGQQYEDLIIDLDSPPIAPK